MNYKQFLDCVQDRVLQTIGEEVDVDIRHVLKNNGRELDGLTIMCSESEGSPTIYLNDYYEQFMSGRNIDSIVREIIQMYEINRENIKFTAEEFKYFENVRSRIVYKLINYDANKKLLENVPFKRFLDLAVVFCVLVEQKEESSAAALIHNSHMNLWNVTSDEICEIAKENSPRLLPYRITRLDDILGDEFCDEFSNEPGKGVEMLSDSDYMYVLSNELGIHGAACMLYDGILQRFSQRFGSDIIIIPSSVHEVLLIPWKQQYDIQELNSLVRDVNDNIVDAEEMLAQNVYLYCRDEQITVIAS